MKTNILFSEVIIERAGNKSLLIFLNQEATLFETSRIVSGLYVDHDDLGLYIEKTIREGESYITFLRWDCIVAVTNDVNQYD